MRRLVCVSFAAALAGCSDTESESASAWFVEDAQARGLDFVHDSGAEGAHLMPECIGGGAALFDMDGDGDLDAYLVQTGSARSLDAPRESNRLYENLGDGEFRDVTAASGSADRGCGMGVACGDVDGDGDIDLYVTNWGANRLFVNAGDGTFTDATSSAGVGHEGWGTSAAFLDFDRDGALDLYVCNYLNWLPTQESDCTGELGLADYCDPQVYQSPARDVLYRGRGDGTFENVTLRSGIDSEYGTGLGVVCGDFDGDGWIDVFVANDGMRNFLWRNRGDGTFVNDALRAGCALDANGREKAGMGVTAADIDDDADLDLLVCNLNRETDSFYENRGGVFSDRTSSVGLGRVSRAFTRFGLGWVDFDQDGRLDLYQANGRVMRLEPAWSEDMYAEPNLLFRQSEGGRFEELSPRGGTARQLIGSSRAAAFGDVDGDGAIDVLVVERDGPCRLLLNRVPGRGRSLRLDVREHAGSPALGATLSIEAGERLVTRDVRSAYSYLASNSPLVHVGLGDASGIAGVTVRWVDGTYERFGPLDAGGRHVLMRGAGEPAPR